MKDEGGEIEWSSSPWAVESLLTFQLFCCPQCLYQVEFKQDFVNHAFLDHPECIDYFKNIHDGSMSDVDCPWELKEIKEEEELQTVLLPEVKIEEDSVDDADNSFENDYSMSNDPIETSVQNDSSQNVSKSKKTQKKVSQTTLPKMKKTKTEKSKKSKDESKKKVKAPAPKPVKESCTACDFKGVALKPHWDKVHKELPYPLSCNLCSLKFAGTKYLQKHVSIAHRDKTLKYKCVLCPWRGPSLKQHWVTDHANEPLPILCDKCDYRTYNKTAFTDHTRRHHSGNVFQCKYCPYKSGGRDMLNAHTKQMHTNNEYHCDKCGKVYKWQRSLDEHLLTVHDVKLDEKKVTAIKKRIEKREEKVVEVTKMQCSKCKLEVFKNSTEFAEHVELCQRLPKEPDGIFRCNDDACDEFFNSMEVLKYHLYEKHGRCDIDVCDICGIILKGAGSARKHRQIHLGIKAFKCNECGKDFTTKLNLKHHVSVVHMKIKKISCTECDYKTSHKSHLKLHYQRKHTDEPFQCKFCSFNTRSPKALARHKKAEHPNKAPLKTEVLPEYQHHVISS